MVRSRSYIATPPGATIKEQLRNRGMSQKEFASRMDMSEKHISHLINGDVQLTFGVAYKLEMVLGLPAKFWNNLEAIYRDKLVKAEAENALDKDKEIAQKFPYADMAKNGWVSETKKSEERIINLRKFFEVVQLKRLNDNNLLPCLACRRLSITEKSDFALIAWAQRAKIEARAVNTAPVDLANLKNQICQIRKMSQQNPSEFLTRLRDLLSKCGVALVLLPHIKGSFLHGVTFYDKNKIVIGLTLRGKDADKFWFSLFHEIGHIILGHLEQDNEIDDATEQAADCFAKDALISLDDFKPFAEKGLFTKETVIEFSETVGIAPGIVVGRLQKEGYVKFSWLNDLKTQYEFSS